MKLSMMAKRMKIFIKLKEMIMAISIPEYDLIEHGVEEDNVFDEKDFDHDFVEELLECCL